MKLLKIIVVIIFIILGCYWILTRNLSISPLLMLTAGSIFILNGLNKTNNSVNNYKIYIQCGLGIVLILIAFL